VVTGLCEVIGDERGDVGLVVDDQHSLRGRLILRHA
jgi:hypothetical protein